MEYLEEDLMNPKGYVKKSGKPGHSLSPVALTISAGEVVYGKPTTAAPYRPPSAPKTGAYQNLKDNGLNMGYGTKQNSNIAGSTYQRLGLMKYDDEVERQRRLLADTVLAQIALQQSSIISDAVLRVGRGVYDFWSRIKSGLNDETVNKIVDASGTRLYTATSYGRRDPVADAAAVSHAVDSKKIAQIELWFSELQRTPVDVPKLMSLYDFFYCKLFTILPNGNLMPENLRSEIKKATYRPGWYEEAGPRGRHSINPKAAESEYPGLLSGDMTIPMGGAFERCGLDLLNMKIEKRRRGWNMFSTNAGTMNAQFKDSLTQHNLPFSASASGTTATLLLAAEAFSSFSGFSDEDKKQYLLACIVYLVSGGMHTCHEVFWTGRNAGIDVVDGKYLTSLPNSFLTSLGGGKWTNEFWEFTRLDKMTVQ